MSRELGFLKFFLVLVRSIASGLSSNTADDVQAKLTKYNDCLDRNAYLIANNLQKTSVIGEVGESIDFKCNICPKPDGEPIRFQWKRQLSLQTRIELLEYDIMGDDKFSFENFVISLKNIELHDRGRYWCEQNVDGAVVSDYFLGVVPFELKMPIFGDEKLALNEQLSLLERADLTKYNLNAFVKWNEWSECSKCGAPGFRKRTGTCYVKRIDKARSYQSILDGFEEGVPCKSSFVPKKPKKLSFLKNIPSYSQYEDCNTCSSKTKSNYDVSNKTLGQLTRAELLYIMRTAFAFDVDALKMPAGDVLLKKVGERLFLKCMQQKHSDYTGPDSIFWTFNDKYLDLSNKTHVPSNRIVTDFNQNLIITKSIPEDSGLYKCYVNYRHVTSIQVKFVSFFASDLDSIEGQLFLLGFFMVTCAFLFMFLYSCLSKRMHGKY
jgi:hypothetical protein